MRNVLTSERIFFLVSYHFMLFHNSTFAKIIEENFQI